MTSSSLHAPSDCCPFLASLAVPSAPPRKVEVEVLNSTAIQVFWRSPVQNRQHGQIRGYQVHYVRMENGEARGLPQIKDIMLADAQVRAHLLLCSSLVEGLRGGSSHLVSSQATVMLDRADECICDKVYVVFLQFICRLRQ